MIYVFLADGFEEIEALCPVDIMRRAGLSVVTVGISKKEIVGSHGITVLADITDAALSFDEDIDLIFLPGGMPGTKNLDASSSVHKMIDLAIEQNAYICDVCHAASLNNYTLSALYNNSPAAALVKVYAVYDNVVGAYVYKVTGVCRIFDNGTLHSLGRINVQSSRRGVHVPLTGDI